MRTFLFCAKRGSSPIASLHAQPNLPTSPVCTGQDMHCYPRRSLLVQIDLLSHRSRLFFSVSTPKFSEQERQFFSFPVARSCLQASAARNSLRHRVLLPAAGTGWVGFPRKRPLEIKHARKTPADLISAVGCNMSCARVLFFSLLFFSGATPA